MYKLTVQSDFEKHLWFYLLLKFVEIRLKDMLTTCVRENNHVGCLEGPGASCNNNKKVLVEGLENLKALRQLINCVRP